MVWMGGNEVAEGRDRKSFNPETVRDIRPPGKKDTKKWCKGKVGVSHVPHLVLHTFYGYSCRWFKFYVGSDPKQRRQWNCMHRIECETCNKVLNAFLNPSECPNYPKE